MRLPAYAWDRLSKIAKARAVKAPLRFRSPMLRAARLHLRSPRTSDCKLRLDLASFSSSP